MIRKTPSILAAGIFMVCTRVAISANSWETSPNPCIRELTQEHFSLVEAKVVAVGKPTKREVRATLEVRRVFVGTVKSGMRFGASFLTHYPIGGSFPIPGPAFFYPPPDIGEKQIWVVLQKKDGTLTACSSARFFGLAWPVRNSRRGHIGTPGPKYENCMKLAETVHGLSKATVPEQISILRRGAKSKIPQISRAAALCLKKWKSPACRTALTELRAAIYALPVPNQTYLDEALCEVFGKSWKESPERRKLLESWTGENTLNVNWQSVFWRLQSAWQIGQLDSVILLDLATRIEKNSTIVPKIRRSTLFLVANATEKWRKQDKDGFFRLLTEVIQGDNSLSVQQGAAYVLRNCSWLHTTENILILGRIREHISDSKLAAILDKVLKSYPKSRASKSGKKVLNPKIK